jgi:hypothetical protein
MAYTSSHAYSAASPRGGSGVFNQKPGFAKDLLTGSTCSPFCGICCYLVLKLGNGAPCKPTCSDCGVNFIIRFKANWFR